MKRQKGILYTVIFTLVITFFFVFFLSFANELTKETIERNEEIAFRKAVLASLTIEYDGDDEAFGLFEKEIVPVEKSGVTLYSNHHGGGTYYAIRFIDTGLWGQISGILAVNEDVSVIIGIEFLAHNETPGLGGRIDERSYKDQFKSESVGQGGEIRGTRNGSYDYDHRNGEVDAISGATRTSESIERIVNQELARLRQLLGVM